MYFKNIVKKNEIKIKIKNFNRQYDTALVVPYQIPKLFF